MGIHGVSRHADRVVCHPQPFAIMLGDYILAYHASGFTDIQLLLPSVFTHIFILPCSPSRNLVPNLFWYTGVVGKSPHQHLLVFPMGFNTLLPLLAVRLLFTVLLVEQNR